MSLEPKVNILLVDDHPENLLALEAILNSLDQNLVKATSGAEALRCLLNKDFAVILLDVQMPDMDGFETAALIRQRERTRHTPIIFLTAFSTSDNMVFKGYSVGAVDYLFKPPQPEILKSKVAAFIDLFQKTAEVKRQAAQLAAMNAELEKREELFRCLSACSPIGIFITDVNGKYTYTNPRFLDICGVTTQESLGEGWAGIIYPEDKERVIADWYNVSIEGKEYKGEFRILTETETEVWVYLSSSPMVLDEGELIGYVATVQDISDRKQAQEEHVKLIREQTARKEAETANRLKDEFLATLSHELRTPLNAILGWAKLLRQKEFDSETIARALETIERNAISQTQLINDILDVSRIIRGKLRLVQSQINLVSLVSQAVENVRLNAETKSLDLKFLVLNSKETLITHSDSQLEDAKIFVCGDINRLQQVMGNLLSNAVKFTPKNGKIEVQLETISSTHVQVRINDTGCGISQDFLPYVFDRFRQQDSSITRRYQGLGLGLAIVRHLVEMHGGSVGAESPGIGQGSTFSVTLPLFQRRDNEIALRSQELKAI